MQIGILSSNKYQQTDNNYQFDQFAQQEIDREARAMTTGNGFQAQGEKHVGNDARQPAQCCGYPPS